MSIDMRNIFRKTSFVFAAVVFLLMGNTAYADTPDSLKGATVVDAVKAKSLSDSGVMVIGFARSQRICRKPYQGGD